MGSGREFLSQAKNTSVLQIREERCCVPPSLGMALLKPSGQAQLLEKKALSRKRQLMTVISVMRPTAARQQGYRLPLELKRRIHAYPSSSSLSLRIGTGS